MSFLQASPYCGNSTVKAKTSSIAPLLKPRGKDPCPGICLLPALGRGSGLILWVSAMSLIIPQSQVLFFKAAGQC